MRPVIPLYRLEICFFQAHVVACTPRIYILEAAMGTARVFRSGNSQTVRLPKEFRLKSKDVEIFRPGDEIVVREKDGTMARAFELLAELPDDLEIEGLNHTPPQKRDCLNGTSLSSRHQHLPLHLPEQARTSLAPLPQLAAGRSRAFSHHLRRTAVRSRQ